MGTELSAGYAHIAPTLPPSAAAIWKGSKYVMTRSRSDTLASKAKRLVSTW